MGHRQHQAAGQRQSLARRRDRRRLGCVHCFARPTRRAEWDQGADRARLPEARRCRKSSRLLPEPNRAALVRHPTQHSISRAFLKPGRVNLQSPMSRNLIYVFLILIWINAVCYTADGCPQSGASTPAVVLEATNTTHGIGGHENKLLVVRLTDDGKVEWDKPVGLHVSERQTSSVSAEVVSDIVRSLKAVDQSLFRGRLGPYYLYIDTSDELQVRVAAGPRDLTFLVINPWPSGIVQKTMPPDVKTVVCEISKLHAQVTNTAVDQMCKVTNTLRERSHP